MISNITKVLSCLQEQSIRSIQLIYIIYSLDLIYKKFIRC